MLTRIIYIFYLKLVLDKGKVQTFKPMGGSFQRASGKTTEHVMVYASHPQGPDKRSKGNGYCHSA